MTSIICPCIECIHNGKGYKCTAKKLKLSYKNMLTVHEGRQDMWICDQHEVSEEIKEMEANLKRIMEDKQ